MKSISTVRVLQAGAFAALLLVQGCVTTESPQSPMGSAARHKKPWLYEPAVGEEAPRPLPVQEETFMPPEEEVTAPVEAPVIRESAVTAAPVPVTPAPESGATEIYIVQKGDVLSRIAVKFGTSVSTLVALNNLSDPDKIYAGQRLRVPARGGVSVTSVSAASSVSAPARGGVYIVQRGDTLSGIAKAAGVTLTDLRKVNNIHGDKIYAGQKLYIPSYGKVPTHTRKLSGHKKKKVKKSAPEKTEAPAPAASDTVPAPAVEEPLPAPMAEPAPAAPAEAAPADASTVPAPAASADPAARDTVEAVNECVLYPGETLDDVAKNYGVSKSELMRLNNITDESQVKPGMYLRIPVER